MVKSQPLTNTSSFCWAKIMPFLPIVLTPAPPVIILVAKKRTSLASSNTFIASRLFVLHFLSFSPSSSFAFIGLCLDSIECCFCEKLQNQTKPESNEARIEQNQTHTNAYVLIHFLVHYLIPFLFNKKFQWTIFILKWFLIKENIRLHQNESFLFNILINNKFLTIKFLIL